MKLKNVTVRGNKNCSREKLSQMLIELPIDFQCQGRLIVAIGPENIVYINPQKGYTALMKVDNVEVDLPHATFFSYNGQRYQFTPRN